MSSKGKFSEFSQRRQFLKAVGGTAVVTSLAGCTESGTNGSGGGGGGGGDGGDGGDGGGGGDGATSSQVEGPIKVGTLSPTQDEVYGITVPNGAKVAAKEINGNGGVLGADIEVVVKNTEGDPSTAQSKFRELVLQDQVDLVLGPLSSEAAINLMPDIAQQQVVTINGASGTERLTQQVSQDYESYKYLFKTGPLNGYYQGVNMLDFAKSYFDSLEWESVAYVSEGRAWSETQHKMLSNELANTVDMEVTETIRYAGDTEDFTSLYDRIEQSGADGMFSSTAYTTVTAVTQWAKQQRPFGFVGNHTGLMPSMIYDSLNGTPQFTASVNFGSIPGVERTKRTIPFQKMYLKQFSGNPSFPAYHTYDAIHMFAQAAEKTRSLSPSETIPALEQMTFQGSAGTIEFYGEGSDYRHDVKYGKKYLNPVWFQWLEENGEGSQVGLWPDDIASTEYTRPSWI